MEENNKKIYQQGAQKRVKGKADIVFVLDRSGSMSPCLEVLKNNVGDFIESLSSNQQISSVDWRIGFVAFDHEEYYVLDFSTDKSEFRNALATINAGGTELTLPAVDVALDYSWRNDAQRVVILFTDEPLTGGIEIDLQRNMIDELKKKMAELSVKFYYFGFHCPDYWKFNNVPGALMQDMNLHGEALSVDYEKVLIQMGKTISANLTERANRLIKVKRDLFNVSSHVQINRL